MEHWAARPFHRGGLNPSETAGLDRWLFTTEPGLQAYSHDMKRSANHAGLFLNCKLAQDLLLKSPSGNFVLSITCERKYGRVRMSVRSQKDRCGGTIESCGLYRPQ